MERDFHWNFLPKLHGFLRFSLACLTESLSFGHGLKDLVSLHKSAVKELIKNDGITSGTRHVVTHGECVNNSLENTKEINV